MTNKVYRTAGGKTIDMGSLLLQNEEVRAVGNMRVNARGDSLDSNNRIIDQKNRQITRQTRRQTNVNSAPVHSSNRSAQAAGPAAAAPIEETPAAITTADLKQATEPKGGLATAISRSKELKQTLAKTPRQLAQEKSGVRKF